MERYFFITTRRSILIILLVFTLYYLVPMVIAINSEGLNKEDVIKKLPYKIKNRYDQNLIAIAKIDRTIDSINKHIISDKTYDIIQPLNKIRFLEERKAKLDKEFNIAGLNYNRITLIYPVAISLMALVYFIFLKNKNSFSLLAHVRIIILVDIFLMGFNWYRNSPWGQYGRTVFSPYNFDINPYIFFYQEFTVISLVSLIVMIWNKSISEIKEIKDIDINGIDSEKISLNIKEIKRAYYSWQLISVILFGVFGFFSYHFWANVFISNDQRYIYQAVILNILWIITWFVCSIPTILKFEKWNAFKIKIMVYNFESNSVNDISYSNLQKYLFEKEIVSDLNKTISTIILILSFVFPIFKAWAQ